MAQITSGLVASVCHAVVGTGMAMLPSLVRAQATQLDTGYQPSIAIVGETWAQMSVRALNNGQYLCSGYIDSAVGEGRSQIVRVFPDGSADLSFHFVPPFFQGRSGDFPIVGSPVELANGMLVCARTAAVVSPGSPLEGYPGPLYTYYVQILVLDASGAVVPGIGGSFLGRWAGLTPTQDGGCLVWGPIRADVAGSKEGLLVRMGPDGAWQESFRADILSGGASIASVASAPDGRTVVTYALPSSDPYGGYGDIQIARLDTTGGLDSTFVPALAARYVHAVDSAGRVLVSGNPLVRLNEDGALDTTFVPQLGALTLVQRLWLLPDGRMLVTGQTDGGGQVMRDIDIDGRLVRDLGSLIEPSRQIEVLDVGPQGTGVLRDRMPEEGGIAPEGWVRLGLLALDEPQPSQWEPDVSRLGRVTSIVRVQGDALILRGEFDRVDGVFAPGLTRLDERGAVDLAYRPAWMSRGTEYAAVAPDGQVYARVTESTTNGPVVRLERLREDGALDATLPADSDLARTDGTIERVEDDGSVLTWVQLGGPDQPYCVYRRFRSDGELIESWPLADLESGAWRVSMVHDMVRDQHGRLVVTGTMPVGLGAQRYLPDGALDPTYTPDFGPEGSVTGITLLSDGRLLVAALREGTAVLPAHRTLIRLDGDGRLDPTWRVLESDLPSAWETIHPQADGRIVGETIDGRRMARWYSDGARDLGWEAIELPAIASAVTLENGDVYLASWRTLVPDVRGNLYRLRPVTSPGILAQPLDQSVVRTRTFSLQVGLGAADASTAYQWFHDGRAVPGATGARLIIDGAKGTDAGAYRVVVTTGETTYTSDVATVEVLPRQARIVNFSARSYVAHGGAPQIGGFVLGGDTSPHLVLLRAIGGGLSGELGTSELLLAPRLRMFAGDELMAQDEGSALSEGIVAVANRVGAFAPALWSPLLGIWRNDDSALVLPVGAGIYTAQTSSADIFEKRDGVALFEFYDASASTDTRFVTNVSLRGHAGRDARSLIGGLVLQGTGPTELLIRVVGPELAAFGVPGTLDDPSLRLFDQDNRTWIGANDDWTDLDPTWIANAGRSVGAFPLQEGSRSAGLHAVLVPGAYTVVVEHGANSAESAEGGEVLLEFYTVDE